MQNPALRAGQLQPAPCRGLEAKLPASPSNVHSEPESALAPVQFVQMKYDGTIKGSFVCVCIIHVLIISQLYPHVKPCCLPPCSVSSTLQALAPRWWTGLRWKCQKFWKEAQQSLDLYVQKAHQWVSKALCRVNWMHAPGSLRHL